MDLSTRPFGRLFPQATLQEGEFEMFPRWVPQFAARVRSVSRLGSRGVFANTSGLTPALVDLEKSASRSSRLPEVSINWQDRFSLEIH